MVRFIAVAFGGALGAMLRYGTSLVISRMFDGPAPVATWIVNLAGCLLIGFLVPFLTSRPTSMSFQLFVLVGFLGALTTFSTFSMESIVLWQDGRFLLVFLNAIGSVAVGMLLVWAGMLLHSAFFASAG